MVMVAPDRHSAHCYSAFFREVYSIYVTECIRIEVEREELEIIARSQ